MKDIKPVTPQVYVHTDEGFIRLTTDEVRNNLIEAIARVMVEWERIAKYGTDPEVYKILRAKGILGSRKSTTGVTKTSQDDEYQDYITHLPLR